MAIMPETVVILKVLLLLYAVFKFSAVFWRDRVVVSLSIPKCTTLPVAPFGRVLRRTEAGVCTIGETVHGQRLSSMRNREE